MTVRMFLVAATLVTLGAMPALGRQAQSKPESDPKSPPNVLPVPKSPPAVLPVPDPRRAGQPVNIKVDVVVSEQRGTEAPTKRTLAVVVSDRHNGRVRTQSDVAAVGPVALNIDASPEILSGGKIQLLFSIQYDGPGPAEDLKNAERGAVMKTTVSQVIALILENGRPMIAAQSADPMGDRKVTVEVTATILK